MPNYKLQYTTNKPEEYDDMECYEADETCLIMPKNVKQYFDNVDNNFYKLKLKDIKKLMEVIKEYFDNIKEKRDEYDKLSDYDDYDLKYTSYFFQATNCMNYLYNIYMNLKNYRNHKKNKY